MDNKDSKSPHTKIEQFVNIVPLSNDNEGTYCIDFGGLTITSHESCICDYGNSHINTKYILHNVSTTPRFSKFIREWKPFRWFTEGIIIYLTKETFIQLQERATRCKDCSYCGIYEE